MSVDRRGSKLFVMTFYEGGAVDYMLTMMMMNNYTYGVGAPKLGSNIF